MSDVQSISNTNALAVGRAARRHGGLSPYVLASCLVGATALLFGVATLFLPHFLFTTVGLIALWIMLLPPILCPRYDLCSPWSLATMAVVLGLTLRGAYISMQYPDADTIDRFYLLGQHPEFFIWPAVLLLTGLLCMAIGYVSVRPKPVSAANQMRWNRGRLYVLTVITLFVSLASTWLYIKNTGGLESNRLSAKRTLVTHVEGSETNQAHGTLRLLASISIFAHLLVLADCLKPTTNHRRWKLALAAALFISANILPFYASSRTPIALNFCLSASMLYYSRQSFPMTRVVLLAVFAITSVHIVTVLRRGGDNPADINFGREMLDSIVLNRNNLGLCTTAHVMEAVPDQLPYQYGQTIAVWLAAPVPRELWPEKPTMHCGPLVGYVVYGIDVGGLPPGYVAEMFWNFHVPGVIVGCLLLGWGLRYMEECFRPVRGGDLFIAAAYVVGPMQFGFLVFGQTLGQAIFKSVITVVIMLAFLWFIRERSVRTAGNLSAS